MVTPGDVTRPSDGRAPHEGGEEPTCDLYVPGHLVHLSQARKFWESDDPVRWGRFRGVEGGDLVVGFLDGAERYRIHRPAEVARVAEVGDKVRVSERWRVASISRRFEQLLLVGIALPDDPSQLCRATRSKAASLDEVS
jgi:hypothetical protein